MICRQILDFVNRFGIYLDTLAHSGGKINALDICTFGSSRLQLVDGSDEFLCIAEDLLGSERNLTNEV